MSVITDLVQGHVRVTFRRPVRFGREWITERVVGLVRIADRDGRTGLGEAPVLAAPDALGAARAAVLGRTPADLVARGGTWSAADARRGLAGATDAALVDLAARQAGITAATLLGVDGSRTAVAVNALLVVTEDVAAAVSAAPGFAAAGYPALKLKLEGAADGSPAAWWSRALEAVRGAVGERVALRLDLNGALTEDAAAAWLPTIAGLGLEYVEQPVAPADGPGSLARLRAAGVPIAADESVTGPAAAGLLLDRGSCDVLVVKPGRVGGPLAAVSIIRAAAERGIPVTISTLYETGVGLATALHVAATVAGDRAHGLDAAGLLSNDPVSGMPSVRNGRIEVPGPGLGVTLASRNAFAPA